MAAACSWPAGPEGYPCIALATAAMPPLPAAAGGAGFIALSGDLPAAVEAFKASHPLLLYPLRGAIAFPLIYHYLGGLRHVVWEHSTIGKQSDKTSYLENDVVDRSSKAIFGISIAGTLAAMFYSS